MTEVRHLLEIDDLSAADLRRVLDLALDADRPQVLAGRSVAHCLPAHRGEEAAASVVDGRQNVVFPQAHNRLHAFRGLLRFLLEEA